MTKKSSESIMKRVEWLDIARGVTIILMIIGHMTSYIPSIFREAIYSFHMPFFFIVSGYCFRPEKYNIKSFVHTRVKKLLIPYFLFSIVEFVIRIFLVPLNSNEIHKGLKDIFWSGNGYYIEWFFLALFWAEIIAILIEKYVSENERKYYVFVIVLAGIICSELRISLPFKIGTAFTALLFFFLGKNMKIIIDEFNILLGFILWGGTFICSFKIYGQTWELKDNYCTDLALGILMAILGSVLVIKCSKVISEHFKRFPKALSFIGRESFWIYPLSASVPQITMDILNKIGVELSHGSIVIKIGIYLVSWLEIYIFIKFVQYIRKMKKNE